MFVWQFLFFVHGLKSDKVSLSCEKKILTIFGPFLVQNLAIFAQKFDKSSEPAELNRRRDACNSAKWPQYNPFEVGEKKSQNFDSRDRAFPVMTGTWFYFQSIPCTSKILKHKSSVRYVYLVDRGWPNGQKCDFAQRTTYTHFMHINWRKI